MDDAPDTWFMREVYIHHSMLKGFFARRCRQLDNLEDLCQETYFRMLRAYRQLEPAAPKALLFQTAANLLVDLSRREQADPSRALPYESLDLLDPERHVGGARAFAAFREAVAELPPKRRQVLWMRRVENTPVRTIAFQLGIDSHTVEEHVRRALRYLKRRLSGDGLAPV